MISEPKLLDFLLDEKPILGIPYRADKTMGECIEPFNEQLRVGRWILVGHGDYTFGLRIHNPYEQGVYMPLPSQDVDRYQPLHCFLGHIHIPSDLDRVRYPGSPWGSDEHVEVAGSKEEKIRKDIPDGGEPLVEDVVKVNFAPLEDMIATDQEDDIGKDDCPEGGEG